ncbi:MAG: GNAT family N-acetyltransferase [Candidatus Ozemobacteraceae bacterium]
MQQTLKEIFCRAPFFRRTVVAELLELRRRILRADAPHLSASFPGDDDPQTWHFGAFENDQTIACVTFIRSNWPQIVPGSQGETGSQIAAASLGDARSNIAAGSQIVGGKSLKPGEPEPAWQLRGMAVSASYQGGGIGRSLLHYAETELAAASPVRLWWCNARVSALPFYQKLGWTIASGEFSVDGIGLHRKLLFRSEVP